MAAPAWHDHLPKPISHPAECSVQELKSTLDDTALRAGLDYIVVDTRRADMDEAPGNVVIPCAINLPAQTFHQTLPLTFELLHKIPKVIFHCSSSQGRGPRCAAWYQDHLNQSGVGGDRSKAYVLVGGIKAWIKECPEDVKVL